MEGLAIEAGKSLLPQGVLGAATVLLIGTVIFLYRELRSSDKARLDEMTKILESRESTAKALTANALALEANNRAIQERAAAMAELARQIEAVKNEIASARAQGGYDVKAINGLLDDLKERLEDIKKRIEAIPVRGRS